MIAEEDKDCEHEDTEEAGCPNPNCNAIWLVCSECEEVLSMQGRGAACVMCRSEGLDLFDQD